MKLILRLLIKPWVPVLIAVIGAAILYVIASSIFVIENFLLGLFITIGIAISVSLPLVYIVWSYVQQIEKQNKELKRLDFATKKMFSIIAHDVRSPLASLKTLLNAMESNSLSTADGAKYLEQVTQRTDNILHFLDGLLFWSREQIDTKAIKKQRFSTKEVMNSVKWYLLEEANTKNIEISIDEADFQILNDSGSYSFIVRNVIQNAIKFTPENGKVTVTFVENGKLLQTTVKDNGVGISKLNLDKIFAGDNWVSTKGTKDESGSGFGLKTCIYYANLNGGSIEINSVEGTGTVVMINTLMK